MTRNTGRSVRKTWRGAALDSAESRDSQPERPPLEEAVARGPLLGSLLLPAEHIHFVLRSKVLTRVPFENVFQLLKNKV